MGPGGKEPLTVRNVQQEVREESDPAFLYLQQLLKSVFLETYVVCKHMHILCTSMCKAQILSIGEQNILMKLNNLANHSDVSAVWCHTAG